MLIHTSMGRYWRGDGPLWRVYWLHGVGASFVLSSLIAIPAMFDRLSYGALAVALCASAIYVQWLVVSVWRCAPNVRRDALSVRRKTWGVLVRWLTVGWTLCAIGAATALFKVVAMRKW